MRQNLTSYEPQVPAPRARHEEDEKMIRTRNFRGHVALPLLLLLVGVLVGAGCSADDREARHLARGERYIEREAYEEALIEFTNALRLSPTNVATLAKVGLAHFKLGRLKPAFSFLRYAAELDPSNAEVQLHLGTLYALGNDHLKAWEIGESLLARHPDHYEALILLVDAAQTTNQVADIRARMLAQRDAFGDRETYVLALGALAARAGEPEEAERLFRDAMAQHPASARPYSALAALFRQRGRSPEALEAYRAAAEHSTTNSLAYLQWAEAVYAGGDRAGGRALLDDAMAAHPDFAPAFVAAADMALRDRDPERAQALIDIALKLQPDRVQTLVLKGRVLLAQGESKEAQKVFEELIARFPDAADLHHYLGAALAVNRDFDAAERELTLALEKNPNLLHARLLLCELVLMRGRPEQAIPMLERITRLSPNLARAHVLLGAAYRMDGRPDEAIAAFRRLADLAPENPQARYLLGLTLRQQDRLDEALQAFEDSLVAAPDYALAAAQLAEIDLAKQDAPGALARLQQQVATAPNAPGLQFLLGGLHRRMEQPAKAEAAFQRAIELAPTFAGAYMELAGLYEQDGRQAEALALMERAIKTSPSHVLAHMLLAQLRQGAGDITGACQAYEQILGFSPRFAPAANNLAYLFSEKLGKLEEAFVWASKAREWAPQDPAVADTLGWIVHQRGDHRWALTLLRESAKGLPQFPEAQYHFAAALLASGAEAEALELLRALLQSKDDFNGREEAERLLALAQLDPARTTDPAELKQMRDVLAARPPSAATFHRLGLVDERLTGPEAALQQYSKALALDARFLPALLAAAEIHFQQGDLKRARELAIAARDAQPKDVVATRLVGRIALEEGQHAWAYGLLRDAARAEPDDPDTQLAFGLAAFAMGNLEEADVAFAAAARLAASGSTVANQAAACLGLMPVRVQQGPLEETRSRVETALSTWPTCFPALVARAEVLRRAGNLPEAERELAAINTSHPSYLPAIISRLQLLADRQVADATALQLVARGREAAPQNAELADVAGRIHHVAGQCDAAVRILKPLRTSGALSPGASFALGLCLQAQGEAEGATILKQALAEHPEHVLAAQAREALTPAETSDENKP